MSLTKVLLTCALLMTGQTSGDVKTYYTNSRAGRIPSVINPDRRADIREMQLFMSADKGVRWDPIDRITPDKTEGFTYNTGADGEFWFKVVLINQQGKSEPSDPYKGPVAIKLIVDTKLPDLKIVSAQRQNDELIVEWLANEENPDPQTLKIEYRPADSQTWSVMPLTPNATGTARVKLATSSPLVVRLSLSDLAKNSRVVEAQVPGAVAAAGFNASPVVEHVANAASMQAPPPLDPRPQGPPPLALPPNPGTPPPPPGHTALSDQSSGVPLTGGPVAPNLGQASVSKMQAIASTSDGTQNPALPAPPSAPPVQPRGLPPLQIVNDSEIVLEYEVSKVGPSGLKTVEVWVTRDGGASWRLFAEDPEAAQMSNGGKYLRTLKLPEDGVYGISLVVKSKAGLGRPAPRPGDAPEMLVELDTLPPEGTLLPPVPDAQKRNTLILAWTAKDRNLGATPITLEWAEQPTGPWQSIAVNLPNTERYSWTLPPALPSHVYLKMMVKDTAGNVGVAVTRDAQLVDLSEPEGRLIRVTPANKRQ
jgi:hypothetical protein